ncbi:ABC transporter permease [Achromobacter sp. GG226]|uniref:ABC transporter permease n=1 Tax=Verticiella alkaliphila TaxID=2779529 RepID=UPI001C0E4745|nr:ABC transporter permease [Verticiella sp. GG226]MBU4610981.1 ABC transporter permease [Verticiella sp. GG226]
MTSTLWRIALGSLWSRRFTVVLTLVTIAVSVALLLGVERLRQDARQSFLRTVSGIDLVVGARAHPVQLMLYSVFRLGEATNNISWNAYQAVANQPGVGWTVPISLGDSHRGYRVVGTTAGYFDHVRYAGDQPLVMAQGKRFDGLFDAVVGAAVARDLGYAPGERIVLAHGTSTANPNLHDDRPFTVSGVLAPTGTPIDHAIYVSLEAIEAIHMNWRAGTRIGTAPDPDTIDPARLQPRTITAFYVGLERRMAVFAVQRWVNEYRAEPMTAVLPGVALQQLWGLLGTAERALTITAACVVLTGLLGLLAVLLATLEERRREMAILRAVGASPRHVAGLLLWEAALLAVLGTAVGYVLLQGAAAALAPWLQAQYGLLLSVGLPGANEWRLMGLVVASALAVSCVPALLAYRHSVADGITVKH